MRPLMTLQSVRVKRHAGIGLLELMLALSIVAVIIILGTRYYEQSKRSQLTSQFLAQLTSIRSAVQNWESEGNSRASLTWVVLQPYMTGEFSKATDEDPPRNAFGNVINLVTEVTVSNATYNINTNLPEKACQHVESIYSNMNRIQARCFGQTLNLRIHF